MKKSRAIEKRRGSSVGGNSVMATMAKAENGVRRRRNIG